MSRLVVDGSLSLAWYLQDEQDAYADAVLTALTRGDEAIVPPLWPYEVSNGLRMAERRGRIRAPAMLLVVSCWLLVKVKGKDGPPLTLTFN